MDWKKMGDKRYSSGAWTIQGMTWCGGAQWKIYLTGALQMTRPTLTKAKSWVALNTGEKS